jgi:uncharacterized protein (DUF58 family)
VRIEAGDVPDGTAHRLVFRATTRLRRFVLVAAVAGAAGVISGRGALLAVAAAPLLLLVANPQSALPRGLTSALALATERCVEDDEVELVLRVAIAGDGRVDAVLAPPPHVDLVRTGEPRPTSGEGEVRWLLTPRRWGRQPVGPVTLVLRSAAGLYEATVEVAVPDLVVYPAGGSVARAVAPRELPARLGEHASRATGSGVEYAGVRPFAPGDRQRDVDWRATARHRDLYVRQYADERALELVLLLDVGVEAGEPGRSSMDLTVRAATAIADAYLRVHDRVGVVTLGGWSRWLAPDASPRQLHRIAELVMAVPRDQGGLEPGLARVPRRVLRFGSFVCVLSPLLDRRALEAVQELHARGVGMLVVDVLTSEPDVGPRTALTSLALRVWRMEREALRVELASLGVPVLRWDGTGDLTAALLHAMRAVPPGVRA